MLISAQFATSYQPAGRSHAQAFASVYTDMKRECKEIAEPSGEESGSDPLTTCTGYGDYRLRIDYSAWSASIRVESLNDEAWSNVLGEDYGNYGTKGEKIEWRMAGDKPFAVILRIGKYKARDDGGNPFAAEGRTGNTLVIKGLKGWEHIDFTVDGATANANERARELADRNYSTK
jgi:hypothetical protein